MRDKVEDMVHFDICYAILENMVNSILCSILSLSQKVKICNKSSIGCSVHFQRGPCFRTKEVEVPLMKWHISS